VSANEARRAKRFFVSGRVQGVGYRYFVRGAAERLQLTGYVRNLDDGRVEAYAVGDDARLASLKEELLRGPRGALVSRVEDADASVSAASAFSIVADA
jgi:acylphosphatase